MSRPPGSGGSRSLAPASTAGPLGAALADAVLVHAWVLRRPGDRGLQITAVDRSELVRLGAEFG
jgi:hypothetical protein